MMQHVMSLTQTYPTGACEFLCPLCDRRLVIQWTPYKMIVLEEGDSEAQHSGATGGLSINGAEIETADPRLDVFSDFVSGLGEL